MDLTTDLYLAAGLGALVLAAGVLLRQPGRARSRLFALLGFAVALWNLGVVGTRVFPGLITWHLVYRFGSCAAAALGLHLCVVLTRRRGTGYSWLLRVAYLGAALLYVVAWRADDSHREIWNISALTLFGFILLTALGLLLHYLRSLVPGPERSAYRLFFAGGVAVALGGLSDLIPRRFVDFPRIAPVATLFFLLVVCALVVRHRFFDVDRFFAKAVALLLGAALASVLLFPLADLSGDSILPLFLGTLLVLALAGPVGRALHAGARSLVRAEDPVARAVVAVSRKMPRAVDSGEIWSIIEEGIRSIPGAGRVAIHLRQEGDLFFRPVYHQGGDGRPPVIAANSALTRLLDQDRSPWTRRFLEEERLEGKGVRRTLAEEALEQFRLLDTAVVVPLSRHDRLVGWIGIRSTGREETLSGEVAAALLAVGNQAAASLERLEAVEEAKRKEALAAVGEMAAGLAHEVRNPLSAIQGAAQVLDSEEDPSRAAEMREVIQEEASRLGRVVGEFLDYARPSSSRREEIDLGELARRTLRAADAAGTAPRAEVRVAPGSPFALGDPDQLQRALMNLVQNAWEAGGSEPSIRIEVSPESPGRVALRFEDDGPGIAPQELPHIFKPFHTTKTTGTGLGLALVHRVIESHGGEVTVEGRPGTGAAFTITLPATGEPQ